jgi:hypothetical protein
MSYEEALEVVSQAAKALVLEDFRTRSVWDVAKEDGRYVREVLEERYKRIAGREELTITEQAAIETVAENPPIPAEVV